MENFATTRLSHKYINGGKSASQGVTVKARTCGSPRPWRISKMLLRSLPPGYFATSPIRGGGQCRRQGLRLFKGCCLIECILSTDVHEVVSRLAGAISTERVVFYQRERT